MQPSSAITLGALASALGERYGDRPAISDEHQQLSFAQMAADSEQWAAAFHAGGVTSESHVGLLAANSCEWLTIAFGAWRAGATLVPISTFVTGRELAEILAHADIDTLIVRPQLRAHSLLELLESTPLPKRVRQIIVAGDTPVSGNWIAAGEFIAANRGSRGPDRGESEATACVLYTSGTTGRPKGVMLSHRAILATVFPTARRSGLSVDDSLLSSLPLFWVAGLVIRALPTLAAGCHLILMETFTADTAITALELHHPTALHLRPPQIGQLLAHPKFRPELLARVRKGNGRIEWFANHLPADARFITGYGMTEMAGYVTALDWNDGLPTRADFGAAMPGVEHRIGDGAEIGEIEVRGPGLFSGYYKEPVGAGLTVDGWFRTGDLGSIDTDGTLHFSGRSKDLLRVKGINVSPLEVETVIGSHPAIEAAYVVGLPPDALEQRLVALVVTQTAIDESQLHAFVAERLSAYKRPEAYLQVDRRDIPLGQTSKPQRAQLAALAQDLLGK